MVFTDAYSNAANCQPARACLLSGNYGGRHHVFAVQSTSRGPKNLMRLIPIQNKDGLADNNETIADMLKATSYITGHFGKWHLYVKGGENGPGGRSIAQSTRIRCDPVRGSYRREPRGTKKDQRVILKGYLICPNKLVTSWR